MPSPEVIVAMQVAKLSGTAPIASVESVALDYVECPRHRLPSLSSQDEDEAVSEAVAQE